MHVSHELKMTQCMSRINLYGVSTVLTLNGGAFSKKQYQTCLQTRSCPAQSPSRAATNFGPVVNAHPSWIGRAIDENQITYRMNKRNINIQLNQTYS